ncbi:hypothetical protein G7046_g4087 [Stylonectria norvegica]|nr:hypothetical protein G7046_g4087 [Stylonectria norvegica]
MTVPDSIFSAKPGTVQTSKIHHRGLSLEPHFTMVMELTLDDVLFSLSDDGSVAVPFDEVNESTAMSAIENSSFGGSHAIGNEAADVARLFLSDYARDNHAVETTASHAATISPSQLHSINLPLPHQADINQSSLFINHTSTLAEFFLKNGASRPSTPCSHCSRLRLQCLILQTTSANPNPISSCSSCVALFRECSLSGNRKRGPSAFEALQPVIGQLHGVSEDGSPLELEGSLTALTKKSGTRSVRKTRVLRNWLAGHMDHPYPSEEEKIFLAKESGLSKTQVINWFANTRRRQRISAHVHRNANNQVFPRGSPMPQGLHSYLSPMERWRNSLPDEEPAAAADIETALSAQINGSGSLESLEVSAGDGPGSSTSGDSLLYPNSLFRDGSSNSASSCYSFRSNENGHRASHSADSSLGERSSTPWLKSPKPKVAMTHIFQCTFCKQPFKKKYDWVRHEKSLHLRGLDSFICRLPIPPTQSHLVWPVNSTTPQCIFCGHASPTDAHIQSHEFESCLERPISERTFTRKDHLWQHLRKFHGCRKREGWRPDLELLQSRETSLRSCCGFCGRAIETWKGRVRHLAGHFREGMTMEQWVGGCGIEGVGSRVWET